MLEGTKHFPGISFAISDPRWEQIEFWGLLLKLAAEGVAEKVSLHLSLSLSPPFHLPFNNGRPPNETSSAAVAQSGLFVGAHSD